MIFFDIKYPLVFLSTPNLNYNLTINNFSFGHPAVSYINDRINIGFFPCLLAQILLAGSNISSPSSFRSQLSTLKCPLSRLHLWSSSFLLSLFCRFYVKKNVHWFCCCAHRFWHSRHPSAHVCWTAWETCESATHSTHSAHIAEKIVIVEKRSSKATKASEASSSYFWPFSFAEKAAEEGVIIEFMIVKEFGKETVSILEIKMMETLTLGPLKAISVIDLSFFRVRKILISFWDLSEFFRSFLLVIGIFVGMPLNNQFFVSFFDISLRCFFVNSKYLVVIPFRHMKIKK